MKNFHKRLKTALKSAKITQTALAKHLNVSQASVWLWLNKDFPSVERVAQICEYAKIDPKWLLGLENSF